MGLDIKCPNYCVLSKRLLKLNIPCPRYCKKDTADGNVAAMAIDSTGLKRFGRDEWHQEKHKVLQNVVGANCMYVLMMNIIFVVVN